MNNRTAQNVDDHVNTDRKIKSVNECKQYDKTDMSHQEFTNSVHSDLLQIIIYHIQDIRLFHVEIPGFHVQGIIANYENYLSQIFRFSLIPVQNICIGEVQAIGKALIDIVNVPIMICMFVSVYLLLRILEKCRVIVDAEKWYGKLLVGFLLLVMYANQKVTLTAFKLIYCVSLNNDKYLFIYADLQCYHIWQVGILLQIVFFIIPQCLIFLIGPRLLHHRFISTWQIFAGLAVPLPFVIYWLYKFIGHGSKVNLQNTNVTEKKSEILNEIYNQYDAPKLPFPLCWCGLIEFRRLMLVITTIFISSPSTRLFIMIFICLIALLGNACFNPYKSSFLNIATVVSILSQIFAGIINQIFATVNLVEGLIPDFLLPTFTLFFNFEEILSLWVPFGLIILFIITSRLQK